MKALEYSKTPGIVQLALAALVMLAGYFAISSMGDLRPRMTLFFAFYSGIFAVYFLVVLKITRTTIFYQPQIENGERAPSILDFWGSHQKKSVRRSDSQILLLILAAAFLFRLVLLWDHSFLSDDIYRYIWDGHVWASGVNPYMYAPADAALDFIRDRRIYPFVNHPEIPTIYAPVLQAVFRLTYEISPTLTAFKIAMTILDFGVIAALIALLKALKSSPFLVLIYAWNPLVIVETAGGGHIDSVGVFFLILFFNMLVRRRFWASAVFMALATLTKFVALLMLPFVCLRLGFKKAVLYTILVGLMIFLAYLPFIEAGDTLYKALTEYTTRWKFNASLFEIPFRFFSWISPNAFENQILDKTKFLLGSVFTALWLWLLFDGDRRDQSWLKYWFFLFATICALSPTLHPWYLIWLAPFLAISPNRGWILLTGLVMFSYEVIEKYYFEGVWRESVGVRLFIYIPFYTLLFYDFWRTKGRRLTIATIQARIVNFPVQAFHELKRFFS